VFIHTAENYEQITNLRYTFVGVGRGDNDLDFGSDVDHDMDPSQQFLIFKGILYLPFNKDSQE